MGTVAKFPITDKQYRNKRGYFNSFRYRAIFNDLEKIRIHNYLNGRIVFFKENNKKLSGLEQGILLSIAAATITQGTFLRELKATDLANGYVKDWEGEKQYFIPVDGTKRAINRGLEKLAKLGLVNMYEYTSHDRFRRERSVQLLGINMVKFKPVDDHAVNVQNSINLYLENCQNTLKGFLAKHASQVPLCNNSLQNVSLESHFVDLNNNNSLREEGNTRQLAVVTPFPAANASGLAVQRKKTFNSAAACHNEESMKLSDIVSGKVAPPPVKVVQSIAQETCQAPTYKTDERGIETISRPKLDARLRELWKQHYPHIPLQALSTKDFYRFKNAFLQPQRFTKVADLFAALEMAIIEWDVLRLQMTAWAASKGAAGPQIDLPYLDARLIPCAGFIFTHANKTDPQKELALIRSLAGDQESLIQTLINRGIPEDVSINLAKRIQRANGVVDKEQEAERKIATATKALQQIKEAERRMSWGQGAGSSEPVDVFYDD